MEESTMDEGTAMAVPDLDRDVGSRRNMSRRAFVRRSSLVAGGLLALGTAQTMAGPASAAEEYAPQALTDAELTTLKAVIDRLIPTDDLGPGASDSNVHAYIDHELTAYFKDMLPLY
jgi:gluconate 2-dehydrogenase gamma chain